MATIDRRGATVSAADPPIGTNPNPDLAIKAPVRVATAGSNITLSGLQTIDGVALAAGDRVLVKDETDATTNGLYNASTGPWTRTIDANNNSQWTTATQVSVVAGTINTQTTWKLTTATPVILGASSMTFALIAFVTINAVSNLTIINNVKSYGAKGDGVSDDYLAINAGISALSAVGGGTLFFPPGTYFTSFAVQPVSGVSIQGAGRDVTIIKGGGIGPSTLNMSLVITATFTGGNHLDNLVNTAITYPINAPTEGANTITTTTAADAGNFAAGQTVLISGDTHATNFWYPDWSTTVVSAVAGTGVITLAEKLPFGGATVTRVQRLLTQPQNIKVSDMTILGTNDASFQVTAGQNIIFDNIAIRAGFGGSFNSPMAFMSCRNCVLQNSVGYNVVFDALGCFDCRFVNNTLNGGTIQLDGGTQNSLVSGNNINDPTDGSATGFHGINLAIYTRRNRVIGNAVVNVPVGFVGINSVGSVAGDGNHIIEGNTITGVSTSGVFGIDVNNSVNNTIVGNWINVAQVGVLAQNNATGQMIDANTLIGVTTPYAIDATCSVRQPFVIGPFTIAGLPNSGVGIAGARATVSDGIASPTYQQAVSATGTTVQPVFCNGSAWIYD